VTVVRVVVGRRSGLVEASNPSIGEVLKLAAAILTDVSDVLGKRVDSGASGGVAAAAIAAERVAEVR
jgi:hypothetical protein